MKNIYSLLLFLTLSFGSSAQITITSSDMPSANDSIRMSSALNAMLFNFTQTDTNHTWDYSNLIPFKQRTEKYMSMNATPMLYRVLFFGKANLASKRKDVSILNINMTDGYNYYKNTSSKFKLVGYGASINGAPVPVVFKDAEVLYNFPLSYGRLDSNDSEWEVSVPGLGYMGQEKHRVNTVDGWGTIITPYGSFQCIRVKSEVHQVDTIFQTSLNAGVKIPSNYTEYIWLSKTIPFPILIARVPNFGLTTVEYADSVRQFVGIEEASTKTNQSELLIYPNPATNRVFIRVNNLDNLTSTLNIYNVQGKIVYQQVFTGNINTYIECNELGSGLYMVRLQNEKQNITQKLIIQ